MTFEIDESAEIIGDVTEALARLLISIDQRRKAKESTAVDSADKE